MIDYVLNNLKTGGVLSDVGKLNSLLTSAKEYVQFPGTGTSASSSSRPLRSAA